jgi:hypothetical protein
MRVGFNVTEVNIKKLSCEVLGWFHVDQISNRRSALVDMAMTV